MSNPRRYFVCGNTAQGFVNYFSSNLKNLDRVYILKGGPGTGKSTMMKKIGEYFMAKDMDIDYIYCSSDPASLDGVIIKDLSTAIVDGTAPHIIEPTAPGAIEEYINLGICWDREKLTEHKRDILRIQENISSMFRRLYGLLRDAKVYHSDLEKIYIKNTDFSKIDEICENLISEVFDGVKNRDREPLFVHRFFGALTADGSVNHIENLTENINYRYFIKGRPGTGKSSLLKKLASKANLLGLDVEVYHCALDSDSIDMVIIPELTTCFFDATPPHELFPSRDGDVIIDIYETAVSPDAEHNNISQICEIKSEYNQIINQASTLIKEIRKAHDDLESYYINAVDYSITDTITQEIIEDIKQ